MFSIDLPSLVGGAASATAFFLALNQRHRQSSDQISVLRGQLTDLQKVLKNVEMGMQKTVEMLKVLGHQHPAFSVVETVQIASGPKLAKD